MTIEYQKKVQCKRALDLIKQEKFSEAAEVLSAAIDLDYRDYRLFLNRSYCYQKLNDFERALYDANSGILLNSDHISGHYRLGCTLLAMKRFRSAEKAFLKALELKTDDETKHKLKETHRLFLKEFGFQSQEIEEMVSHYNTCSELTDALIAGDLIPRFSNHKNGSNAANGHKSAPVLTEDTHLLASLSVNELNCCETQSQTSEGLATNGSVLSRSSDLIGFSTPTPSSDTSLKDETQSLRLPKSNPFKKRSNESKVSAEALSPKTEKSIPSSSESTPTQTSKFIKTRPQIRRSVI